MIDLKQWAERKAASDTPAPSRAALVIDVSPDRQRASIGVAGDGPDGKTLVMVVTGPGTAWVVPEVVRLCGKRDVVEVAVFPQSAAGALIPDLVKGGVGFEALTRTHLGQATASFIEGVKDDRLTHVGQMELDAAVANARTRFSGEAALPGGRRVNLRRTRRGVPLMLRPDRIVRNHLRTKFLITTHGGQTWRAVLMEADEHTLSLFDVESLAPDGTATPADGQVLLPRGDVAYMQIV